MKTEIHFTSDAIVIPPSSMASREIGACVEFQGIVRETENGATLTGLHYEAYRSMAETILRRHLDALAAKYGCASVHFIHRLGWVPVGEPSLFIRVESAHRGEALQLLAEAIDLLKTDVPVWKVVRADARP
ncbi:MAG: molybdenum cofactor biosynthesis protein MoaE [Chthoniobacteraceae bacterium]